MAEEEGVVQILLVVIMLIVCMLVHYASDRLKLRWLPESVLFIAVGFIAGVLEMQFAPDDESMIVFEPGIFFYALLPPIILGAGYTLRRKRFMRNIFSILVFAVLGTLVSTVGIGMGLYGLSQQGILPMLSNFSILDALTYGALISAVDPVATLSILGSKDVNADKTLYAIVFGESVLNDAVCIVLFDTLQVYVVSGEEFTADDAWGATGTFFGVSFASIALGLGFGLLTSFVFKHTYLNHHPSIEFLLVLLSSYTSYLVAELLGVSGVMAIFICGIVLAHYNWYNLSRPARASTRHGLKALAMAAETFVFVYIGITAALSMDKANGYVWSFKLIGFVLLLCLLARGLQIMLFSACLNLKRKKKIHGKMQVVMWFAGLRGAIAFALALNLTNSPNKSVLETTTLGMVLFTTIVCGSLTEKLVDVLDVRSTSGGGEVSGNAAVLADAQGAPYMHMADQRSQESFMSADSSHNMDNSFAAFDRQPSAATNMLQNVRHGFHKYFHDFDDRYLKPVFGGQHEDRVYALDQDPLGHH